MTAARPEATVTEVGAALAAGEVTSRELTELMLARIGTLDAHRHAYATVTATAARSASARADTEAEAGLLRGPLHGIPVAVKELFDVSGVVTGAGMPLRTDEVAGTDSTAVARLRAAGAVLLGTLTMTEGGYFEHHPDVAVPRNPIRDDLWPGASSSGSGVAVAGGLAYAALGTDTGGSIRFPAAANGLVGLKPTRGRISRAGVFGAAESLDHVGSLTRSVADAAVVFHVLAGPDPADPSTLDVPAPGTPRAHRSPAGVRVGVDPRYLAVGVEADVADALDSLLADLVALGARRVEVAMPDTTAVRTAWTQLCAVEAAHTHRATYPRLARQYGALAGFLDLAEQVTSDDLAGARRIRTAFTHELDALLAQVDLLVVPTQPVPAVTISEMDEILGRADGPGDLSGFIGFATPLDMSGHPSLTLPLGSTADGRPLSGQLVAARLGEDLLFDVGRALERERAAHR